MKVIATAVASAVLGSALSLTLVGQAQAVKTPSAVAFVSASRILSESTAGKAEATKMQTLQQQKTAELRAKQQTLEATRQQLATTADAGQRLELQQKEIQQRTDLERSTQQAQVDFQTLQREVNTELQRRVRAVLDDLMKTQSYQLVINSDLTTMWASPDLDLTTAVIGRMNEGK
jgi:Skp family chaperone for outer membrane proteins